MFILSRVLLLQMGQRIHPPAKPGYVYSVTSFTTADGAAYPF